MKRKTKITLGSGNVFQDLGFQNAEEHALKAELVIAIIRTIEARGFKNQTEAASRMGIDQPRVSRLIRGHFGEYSVERLLEFLAALGNDVEIRVKRHTAGGTGRIRVKAA